MTVQDPNPIDRTEQKRAFALRYHTNRNDAIMHAAKVLGDEAVDNPMLAINFGNAWPFDPVVVAELERLDNASKAKGEYEARAFKSFEICMERGEESAAVRFLELAATLAGHVNKRAASGKSPDGNDGEGHEQDLIDAIIDPNNRRDDSQAEVAASWQ